MLSFRLRDNPHTLVVGMAGVKMGYAVAQIGCAHGGRLAAVAGKVGLSGRAVAIVPDEPSATRARKGTSQAGVLIDLNVAPPTRLPAETGGFDLVVIDDTSGLLGGMPAEDRVATTREVLRILRPGGRVLVIGAAARGGLGAFFSRAQGKPRLDPTLTLQADGFKLVRTLAEREGLIFFEGLKPKT